MSPGNSRTVSGRCFALQKDSELLVTSSFHITRTELAGLLTPILCRWNTPIDRKIYRRLNRSERVLIALEVGAIGVLAAAVTTFASCIVGPTLLSRTVRFVPVQP